MPPTPTPEEADLIARCMALLRPEEITACEDRAADIFGFILGEPRASDDLVRTIVRVFLRAAVERGELD